MTCPNCGAAVAADATTCATCGATLPPASTTPPPPPGQQAPAGAVPLPGDVRTWAMAAHLSAPLIAVITGGLLFFLGPLVVWLIKRDDHPFIAYHGREALNFNLTVLIAGFGLFVAGTFIGFLTFGIGAIPFVILLLVIAVGWLVLSIVAGVKASNGESYRYPLTLRLVS